MWMREIMRLILTAFYTAVATVGVQSEEICGPKVNPLAGGGYLLLNGTMDCVNQQESSFIEMPKGSLIQLSNFPDKGSSLLMGEGALLKATTTSAPFSLQLLHTELLIAPFSSLEFEFAKSKSSSGGKWEVFLPGAVDVKGKALIELEGTVGGVVWFSPRGSLQLHGTTRITTRAGTHLNINSRLRNSGIIKILVEFGLQIDAPLTVERGAILLISGYFCTVSKETVIPMGRIVGLGDGRSYRGITCCSKEEFENKSCN